DGCGNALGHDRRADDGRHDQHMVANPDAPVRTAITEEARRAHLPLLSLPDGVRPSARTSSGSAIRPSRSGVDARSPRPRSLDTLCVCTCAPDAMSAVAIPIELPYLTMEPPVATAFSASLCPRGIDSRTVTDVPLC